MVRNMGNIAIERQPQMRPPPQVPPRPTPTHLTTERHQQVLVRLSLGQRDGDAGRADREAPRPAARDVELALAVVVDVEQLVEHGLGHQVGHCRRPLERHDGPAEIELVADDLHEPAARLADRSVQVVFNLPQKDWGGVCGCAGGGSADGGRRTASPERLRRDRASYRTYGSCSRARRPAPA